MNSDKSQEELKAMTFEEWWKRHEKHFEKNVHDKQTVSKMGFEGGRKSRDAEVLALLEGLKVAKEALEYLDSHNCIMPLGKEIGANVAANVREKTKEALSAITPLLKEKEDTYGK